LVKLTKKVSNKIQAHFAGIISILSICESTTWDTRSKNDGKYEWNDGISMLYNLISRYCEKFVAKVHVFVSSLRFLFPSSRFDDFQNSIDSSILRSQTRGKLNGDTYRHTELVPGSTWTRHD